MKIDFDLPLLRLKGATLEDESFKYNGYRLETWNSNDLIKITESCQAANEFFFQEEMSIDKELLKVLGIDTDKITFELANLLFGNLETAANLQKHTGARFDEIKIEFEGQRDGNRYSIDGTEYDVYYESELIEFARDQHLNYVNDLGVSELIGDVKYISDYYDVIDPDKLWEAIEEYAEEENLDLSEVPDDTKKAIQWFASEISDDDETIFEIIDEKGLFDYDTYTNSYVQDIDAAIDVAQSYLGDMEYSGEVELDGWKPSTIYIFERY